MIKPENFDEQIESVVREAELELLFHELRPDIQEYLIKESLNPKSDISTIINSTHNKYELYSKHKLALDDKKIFDPIMYEKTSNYLACVFQKLFPLNIKSSPL